MNRLYLSLLGLAAILFAGCGSDTDSGNIDAGRDIFESPTCNSCHVKGSDGLYGWTFPNVSGSGTHLDDSLADLSSFIASNMPPGNATACQGQCAQDTAAFLSDYYQAWNNTAGSSSKGGQSSSRSSSSVPVVITDGKTLFEGRLGCSGCHGVDGQGDSKFKLGDYSSPSTLAAYIEEYMPKHNGQACGQECAEVLANYIWPWRPAQVACNRNNEVVQPRQLRLLTPSEYQNTVNDLMRFESKVATNFPSRDPLGGYDNNIQASAVGESHAIKFWEAAATLAFSEQFNFLQFVYCGESESANQCAGKFLDDFGKRAFRRPLTSEEKANYQQLWAKASNHDMGSRMVVQAMLMSPNFLYRPELGANGKLTKYEIANLLSYTFIGSMPDQGLFDSAQYSNLDETSQIRQQVERLLKTDRAKARMAKFGRMWLGAETVAQANKDSVIFPEFTTAVKQAMDTELDLFLGEMLAGNTTTFADLYLADFVYANDVLANFYGLNGAGNGFSRIAAGASRGGILELGGMLSTHAQFNQTSPIKRGKFVRERLLCQELPPPPPGLNADPPLLDLSKSTRERFAIHTDNEDCASCHQYIDNIGFSFEKYDGAGQFRHVENGSAIDDSGILRGIEYRTDLDETNYFGTGDLAQILANADSAAACLAEQFHMFMDGEKDPDPCRVENTVDRWQQKSADYTIQTLWLEAVSSPTFIQRR